LGNSEAIKAYELVLKNFADRPEEVAVARERLAALRQGIPFETALQKVTIPELWEWGVLSPDGPKIAGIDYTIGQNIAVYDLSTKQKTLVTQFKWTGKDAAYTYYPVWRPDGSEIAYSQSDFYKAELWASSLDGNARFLCRAEEGEFVPMDWLSDGSAVLTALYVKEKYSQLGLVPSSSGHFRTLSEVPPDFNSADASPDGLYIVFDGGSDKKTHDIVIMSMDGRTKALLAEHPADDISPRWSPDVKHVVFLSRRHGSWALWGIAVENGRSTGQPFMIKDGMDNVNLSNWTAGSLIYAKYINIWDIYTMPVDPQTGEPAGKPELISYAPSGTNRGPCWSHDGKFLAFTAFSPEAPREGRVIVIPTEGGRPEEFLILSDQFRVLSVFGIRWYQDDSGLGLNGIDRENRHVLFHLKLKTGEWKAYPVKEEFPRIEWGKDGKSYYYANWRGKDQNPGIIEHHLDSGQERYVYRPEKIGNDWDGFKTLKASRDYKWLGFMEASGDSDYGIVVVDLEAGRTWKPGPGMTAFAWSPDRKLMMAAAGIGRLDTETPQGAVLYVIPSEGGEKKKIDLNGSLPKGEIMSVDWSPDGKKIVFDVYFQVFEIYLIKNPIPKEGK
jgi:Tol biopolymer transport system component